MSVFIPNTEMNRTKKYSHWNTKSHKETGTQ